ncbi:hypothetical protein BJ546DRAFT_123303 [Cryomyces antarcticus]
MRGLVRTGVVWLLDCFVVPASPVLTRREEAVAVGMVRLLGGSRALDAADAPLRGVWDRCFRREDGRNVLTPSLYPAEILLSPQRAAGRSVSDGRRDFVLVRSTDPSLHLSLSWGQAPKPPGLASLDSHPSHREERSDGRRDFVLVRSTKPSLQSSRACEAVPRRQGKTGREGALDSRPLTLERSEAGGLGACPHEGFGRGFDAELCYCTLDLDTDLRLTIKTTARQCMYMDFS